MNIEFRTLTDLHHAAELLPMMQALYREDEPACDVSQDRFPETIRTLVAEPARGRIILFRDASATLGYAIMIPYWSNEYGGTLLFVDEIFVVPEARSRGIGRQFFEFVFRERPFGAVAAAVEVSPANIRARQLYESIGFRVRRNACLTCPIPAIGRD